MNRFRIFAHNFRRLPWRLQLIVTAVIAALLLLVIAPPVMCIRCTSSTPAAQEAPPPPRADDVAQWCNHLLRGDCSAYVAQLYAYHSASAATRHALTLYYQQHAAEQRGGAPQSLTVQRIVTAASGRAAQAYLQYTYAEGRVEESALQLVFADGRWWIN